MTDAADLRRRDHVRPPGWNNPTAAAKYDLAVIGGGTAGLVSALGAAGLGARVALVERDLLGGDCLNTGCVPSKALIRSARVVGEMRRAAALGVVVAGVEIDFPLVMRRMRERRATIAAHDAAARLRDAGVDVFFGAGKFADARTLLVDGQRLSFGRAVIATGGRPAAPPVPGLDAVAFLTSESIFSLTVLPRRLLIIGGGPIGCELAQAFARFGSAVTIVGRGRQLLPREDAAAAALVTQALERDGVTLELGATLERVEGRDHQIEIHARAPVDGAARRITGDVLLVAAGRAPNIEDLDLEAAGIASTKHGVTVTPAFQTTNRRVYASGDVCSDYKFTHAADATSRVVIQNALFFGRRKADSLIIPWVTYTDPEVAHVGVSEAEVAKSAGALRTITIALSEIDRAIVDDDTEGFVRVHHERGVVRGATIVAPHAGEMIGEVVYAMGRGGTLAELSATVHPYPTLGEAIRVAGDVYRRESLTPRIKRWLDRYFRWTR